MNTLEVVPGSSAIFHCDQDQHFSKCTSKGATFETPYLANWHGLGVTYNVLLSCLLLFRVASFANNSRLSVLKLARVHRIMLVIVV